MVITDYDSCPVCLKVHPGMRCVSEKSHFERWSEVIAKTPSGAQTKGEKLEAERREFQEWYEADAMPLEHSNWFRMDADGDYEMNHVQWAWQGWRARAGLPRS